MKAKCTIQGAFTGQAFWKGELREKKNHLEEFLNFFGILNGMQHTFTLSSNSIKIYAIS